MALLERVASVESGLVYRDVTALPGDTSKQP